MGKGAPTWAPFPAPTFAAETVPVVPQGRWKAMSEDAQQPTSFRYYLITASATGVGVCARTAALQFGELVTAGSAQLRWRVRSTLGQVARVERDP